MKGTDLGIPAPEHVPEYDVALNYCPEFFQGLGKCAPVSRGLEEWLRRSGHNALLSKVMLNVP